jgi:16S rRNA processing protein RimM
VTETTKTPKPVRRPVRRKPVKTSSDSPQYLVIGKVLRPHGIRGELRLEMHTDTPAHLQEVDTVYVGEKHKAYRLKSFRVHMGLILVTLAGLPDRTTADALRGEIVSVKFAEAAPLKQGEFYHHQVMGLQVVSDTGEALGVVSEIITTGANDVYVVKGEAGEILLPAIKSVILKIEPPLMTVHLLEGLR